MSRITLAPIILIVRSLIDDTSATPVFTDDEVQRALDARRTEARYVVIDEKPTIAPHGSVQYLTFDAPMGMWEEGETIVDADYATLTPTVVDRLNGRWTVATQPLFPVRIVGFTHDAYGAAADLLMVWSRKVSDSFDVAADGVDLKRSQRAQMLADRGLAYLARARARSADLVRTDEAA